MAKETLQLTTLIFIISFVTKIPTSHAQPSLTEYLLATLRSQGTPIPPTNPSRPLQSFQNPTYGPSYQNYQNPPVYTSSPVYANPPKPSPSISGPLPAPLTAIANLAAAIPVPDTKSKTPTVPRASEIPLATLDSNVLNNLAIALQLLIVSNILNTPPAENSPQAKFDFSKFQPAAKIETVPISPLSLSCPLNSPVQSLPYSESPARSLYAYNSPNLLNSKFIGSSGFIEPSMFGSALTSVNPRVNPRSSMTLMSPYEALGPNSPFSDSVLSSLYGTSCSKKDFQSPYASILAADGQRDVFSVTDFF